MDIESLRRGLEKPGKSQRGLARALGIDPTAVSRMVHGNRRIQASEIPKITAYLEEPEGAAQPSRTRTEDLVGERDLPVYASAQGGTEGSMLVFPETTVETVRRPEPLMNVPRGFAIYIVGDSMAPAYEQGDLALVHPSLPPKRRDDVLLVRVDADNEWYVLIKRLVSWDEKNWKVEQFEPPKTFTLPRSEWRLVHVVVGRYRRR